MYVNFPIGITCQIGGGQCMTGSLQHIFSRKSCLSFTAQYLNVAGHHGDPCSSMHYTKMATLKNFLVTCLSKFRRSLHDTGEMGGRIIECASMNSLSE